MRTTLVQPPSNRADTSELAPPLGLLTIAAVLRDDDVDVTIVDFNLECLQAPEHASSAFYEWAAARIAATAPDLVGFTSMALESHVCLELGRRLKACDPLVRIILGGPHFSAIAAEVLKHYPWIDAVIVGEGEIAAREVHRAIRHGRSLQGIANVATRDGDQYRLERLLKPSKSFDVIPFPAYDLVDLAAYFRLNRYRVLDFEHARGCVLRCTFCYSPSHWGQGEQARSMERIVEDIHRHHALGARHLFFVADNFLNSKSFAERLCDAIAANNPGITWRCYGTLQQLTEPVVAALARARCKYVFIGVDAVSERTKQRYRKTYFRGWPALKGTVERCISHGVVPTCAFMVHPPATAAAVADTEEALGMAARVYNLGCGVRLNPLTIYAGTGIDRSPSDPVGYSNEKPKILLDGHWMTEQNDYAREHPGLFPFHSTVGPPARYASFVRSTHVGFTVLDHFSITLLQASHAGRHLGTLLADTAARVDYDAMDKRDWRNREAEAFAETLTGGKANTAMRDALAFEMAEFRLRRKPAGVPVSIEVEGVALDACVLPHAELTLSRSPEAYDTTEPVAQQDRQDEARSYWVVPSESGMRYLVPMEGARALLRSLRAAARSGRTVAVPAAGIASLAAANVITFAGKTAEISSAGELA